MQYVNEELRILSRTFFNLLEGSIHLDSGYLSTSVDMVPNPVPNFFKDPPGRLICIILGGALNPGTRLLYHNVSGLALAHKQTFALAKWC